VNRIDQETEKEARSHKGCRAIQEEEEEEEEGQYKGIHNTFLPSQI
jgi:hypothetical protein